MTLVLAELERHNLIIKEVGDKLSTITTQLAILKEENSRIRELESMIRAQEKRIAVLENSDNVDKAITKYKKWIIGSAILLMGSILAPTLSILIGHFHF